MTPLRQRMLDALQVRGMAVRTQQAYIDAVARLARRLLAMPAPNPCALEQAQDFMRRVAGIEIEPCPHCRLGRWHVTGDVPADRVALAVLWPRAARAPP